MSSYVQACCHHSAEGKSPRSANPQGKTLKTSQVNVEIGGELKIRF